MTGAYLPDSVYGYFANGGSICYVVSVKTLGISDDPDLASPAKATITDLDAGGNAIGAPIVITETGTGGMPQTFPQSSGGTINVQ